MTQERRVMILNKAKILRQANIPLRPPTGFQCGKTTLDPIHTRNIVMNVAKKDILLRNVQRLV